jgi:hypothetical protein
MIVAFYTPNLNFRGSCVALYNYALYNETLLDNKSIIITDLSQRSPAEDDLAFKWISNRFQIYTRIDTACDIFYCIKYGKNDGVVHPTAKTVVHCVFDMSEPHGDVYAGVSRSLAMKFGSDKFVPHMVLPPPETGDLRSELGIRETDTVFGRHGGQDTFNLQFAKEVISAIVRQRNDIYFIFLNAPEWDSHPQIIYLGATTDRVEKQKFINTCDAMIVPETMGHTFGMSVAEFSVSNKPVICYNGPVWNTSHIDILGDKGIYFDNPNDFYRILNTFSKEIPSGLNNAYQNAYQDYTPEKVMAQFESVFLSQVKSRMCSD